MLEFAKLILLVIASAGSEGIHDRPRSFSCSMLTIHSLDPFYQIQLLGSISLYFSFAFCRHWMNLPCWPSAEFFSLGMEASRSSWYLRRSSSEVVIIRFFALLPFGKLSLVIHLLQPSKLILLWKSAIHHWPNSPYSRSPSTEVENL